MTKEEVLQDLQKIAKELNLPLDDGRVLAEYCDRGRQSPTWSGISPDIADEIFPMYVKEIIYAVKCNEDTGESWIKRTKDSQWEPS